MDNATDSKTTWFRRLQISEQPVAYMPYQQFRITIYKSSCQSSLHDQYFYSPIAILNPESASSGFDHISQHAEVRFQIEFWSRDIENCVVHYLQEVYTTDIKASNVQLIPFDLVLLSNETHLKMYQVTSKWIPYQLNKFLWFSVLCSSVTKAEELAEEIRSKPQHCFLLKSLRIKFGLTTLEQLQRKQILIHPENIHSTQIFQKINQTFPLAHSVLLTATDFFTLLSESVGEVIHANFNSNDVLDATSTAMILSTVELMLYPRKIRIRNDLSVWNAVFWMDGNLRPDRAAKSINEFYNELDEEAQDRLREAFFKQSFLSLKDQIRDEHLLRILESSRGKIEWDGFHFVPESCIILFKINLHPVPNKYTKENVSVQFTSASLSMAINLRDSSNDFIVQKGIHCWNFNC